MKRRESIAKSLEERKLLTLELKTKVDAAETITTLEDLYLPFRPKKRTRASSGPSTATSTTARAMTRPDISRFWCVTRCIVDGSVVVLTRRSPSVRGA